LKIDVLILIFISFYTIIISYIFLNISRNQKEFLILMYGGMYFYSGVCASYFNSNSDKLYFLYYMIFILIFSISFYFVNKFISKRIDTIINNRNFINIDKNWSWNLILISYIFICIINLIYPTMKLNLIFSPPNPNLFNEINLKKELYVENDIYKYIIYYSEILIFPFFLLSLYKLKKNKYKIFLIICLIIYLNFIRYEYISRSQIIILFGTYLVGNYLIEKKIKHSQLVLFLIIIPIFAAFLYNYTYIRLGSISKEKNIFSAGIRLIEEETSLGYKWGGAILENNLIADFKQYANWLLYLPFPRIFKWNKQQYVINYEMSENLLNVSKDSPRFYVVLSGVVAESIFIYGKMFFWIHAVFIGIISAVLMNILSIQKEMAYIKAFIILTFAFHLNRAGIVGPMGILVNQFILFYIYIYVSLNKRTKEKNQTYK